ncbi:WD40 repeat-like protein [Hortaea werneckii]|nr:WD40 repeat-like protein [Hortaea werneckii]
MLEHVYHRVPVTALAFYGDHVLLAGEGNLLQAYDIKSGAKLRSLQIFEDQSIHGILLIEDLTCGLAWGGSLLRKLRFDSEGQIDAGPRLQATDWILDAALCDENGAVAIVTAHNALSIASLDSAEHDIVDSVVPGSNCILYSAHVTWQSPSQCLVASGTAFGDIIVWSASVSKPETGHFSAQAQTHFTFSAHEGSIFGVQLSTQRQARQLSDRYECLLASCSDDRQVKLWDVSDRSVISPHLTELQRDTGFGGKHDEEEYAPPCLARAMGHVSRIWQVRFVHHTAEQVTQIMSFGEDASNITWSIQDGGDSGLPFVLIQNSVQTAHAGKHIWAVESRMPDRILSGGCDGAIAMRSRVGSSSAPAHIANLTTGSGDSIRAYSFIQEGLLLAVTESGAVGTCQIDTAGSLSMKPISAAIPSLRNYSVIASMHGVAFIGSTTGAVYVYTHEDRGLTLLLELGRKVAFLALSSQTSSEAVHLLVTTVGNTHATLISFPTGNVASPTAQAMDKQSLTLPDGFVVTSFDISGPTDRTPSFVILGARNGSVAILNASSEGAFVLARLIPKVHGKDAVTAVSCRTCEYNSTHCTLLHSTGRDGTYAINVLRSTGHEWEVELVHQLELPLGPNVEGMSFRFSAAPLVWGFRGKQFVLYDLSIQQEIMTVDCGGAHRIFAFQPSPEGGTLVWTQQSKIFKRGQIRQAHQLLNSGGHGREIKAMAVSPTAPQIIATGAEDTNIKLLGFDVKRGFRCMQTLKKHNTGIQHLQWSSDGQYLFSSGGFEEFYVWRISRLPSEIGVICEGMHPRTAKSDLRVMGFEITSEKPIADCGIEFGIFFAYSDSSVQQWSYGSGSWALIASGDYLTACLTEVFTSAGQRITAATDGHLALWNTRPGVDALTWRSRHGVHQNAILDVATHELQDGSSLIFTAGDDNAIGISRIDEIGSIKSLIIPRAHAAAVTGVAIIPGMDNTLSMISVSIDQRLKLWEVSVDATSRGADSINVKLKRNVLTSVADVSSIDVCKLVDESTAVILAGVGMDVWRISAQNTL